MSSVLPLDGPKIGLNDRTRIGAKNTRVFSLANTLLNFLSSVFYIIFLGALSQCPSSLNPFTSPPHAQAPPYSSVAKLLLNPQAIDVNLGS